MKAIEKIPISEIDVADETFSVNFMPDLQSLRSSIQTVGLIQPVLLLKDKDHHRIICGFRRVWVFKELGASDIPAMVFDEREPNDLKFFTLSLQENLTTRGFNAVEKAIALQKLIHRFQVEPSEVIQTYLHLFSLEPNEKILKTFLSLAEMEKEIKQFVLKEEVSRSNIRLLAQMSVEDRMALYPLLSRLKLGENRLREILTLLGEISRRERVTLKEVIDHPEIQALLSLRALTPIQRTERLKRVLMTLRYPKMRELEEEFEKKRKELSLPEGVSIHHSSYFEGKGLRVELKFESMEEYRTMVGALSMLAQREELEELLQAF